MAGAPQISNNWGDLVSMLDACLINGFNLKALDSLSFASGVATATVTSGHTYLKDQVLLITGADQSEYNGTFRVLAVTTNTFSYAVTGAPVSPATTHSNLTAKVAPLGWEIAFTALNKRAYRSQNPMSPQNLLLIDDGIKAPDYNTAWSKWANVGVVEGMADISTIVGAQAPFDPSNPTQNWRQVQAGHPSSSVHGASMLISLGFILKRAPTRG